MRLAPTILLQCLVVLIFVSCTGKKAERKPDVVVDTQPDSARVPDPSVNPYANIDLSPMDITYYPVDYPKLKTANPNAAPPFVRVVYSRPHLQGRNLFQDIVKYGSHWRLGANEATEIQFYRDADILGEKVKAGRYILYCIPQPSNWTIALNSNIDSWGLVPDSTKDIAHFTIPSTVSRQRLEFFTIAFEKSGEFTDLIMAWDKVEARLPIKFE